ncbi:SixA phosphatase family protein [Pontibacter anaerobius]|uniref:Histidine phosphatase family protein n=1 Tax=Pontibacter anaerobius TaxID=2993940 RepID=A0ABT3RB84_9BACT|nr:histidine phosphatase family protein [Pontibacter anaerobius]MCX2739127.1 histidine phosphatase family protein [Pontibacter anaerobius]
MQRIVLLCRHAEAYDPFPLQPDFERELTPAGQQQARNTAKWLREKFSKADALLASPATRANATARIIANRLYFDEEHIMYNPDLYNARESQLMKSLGELPDHVKQVLLVAHNPGITRLARELTEELRLGYLEPADVVAVAVELEQWRDIHLTNGHLLDHFKG